MVAQMGMGLTDTVLLGSIGRDALAAGGLGGSIFFVITGVFQNAVSSVAILISHARGAGDTSNISSILRSGLLLALFCTAPLTLALWHIELLLVAIGEPLDLTQDISIYVQVIVLGTPAAMLIATLRLYLSAMSHPRLILWIAIFGLIANGLLDYGLIYGVWILPELGYLGSAAATAIVLWAMAFMYAAAIWVTPDARPRQLRGVIDWAVFMELNRLGWPIAVLFSVETFMFLAASLLIGTLGSTMLAAHQVSIMIASAAFMIPMAIAQAANVRVGYHLGANLGGAARRAGFCALWLGTGFMILSATTLFTFPRGLALLFQLDADVPSDAEVIEVVVRLLIICAVFQIFDGAQAIGAGILRGYKDTRIPVTLATFSYWVIGFPVAWTLGFPLGYGVEGMWLGLALGLATAAVLLCGRFLLISKPFQDL